MDIIVNVKNVVKKIGKRNKKDLLNFLKDLGRFFSFLGEIDNETFL
jgi:hypothetical protein